FRLKGGERPILRLGRVVELPRACADFRHDAAEPGLDRRDLFERHLPVSGPDAELLQLLQQFFVVHVRTPQANVWCAVARAVKICPAARAAANANGECRVNGTGTSGAYGVLSAERSSRASTSTVPRVPPASFWRHSPSVSERGSPMY